MSQQQYFNGLGWIWQDRTATTKFTVVPIFRPFYTSLKFRNDCLWRCHSHVLDFMWLFAQTIVWQKVFLSIKSGSKGKQLSSISTLYWICRYQICNWIRQDAGWHRVPTQTAKSKHPGILHWPILSCTFNHVVHQRKVSAVSWALSNRKYWFSWEEFKCVRIKAKEMPH